MDANAQALGHEGSAPGAHLRGVFGRDFKDFTGNSFFRFLPENREEPEPTGVPHRFVKRSKTIPRTHFFDVDGIVFAKQMIRGLKLKVPSLVGDFGMGLGDENSSLPLSVGAFLPMINPPLAHSKLIFRPPKESGVFYHLTVAGSEERFATHVDADLLAGQGQWFGRNIVAGKRYKPLASRIPANGYGLNCTLNGAGEPDFESAYLFDGQIFPVKFPASFFKREGIVAVSAFKPGKSGVIAPWLPNLNPTEKPLVCLIQPINNILKNLRSHFLKFRKFFFQVGQFLHLGELGNGSPALSVGGDSLFERGVVKPTTKIKPSFGLSLRRRINPGFTVKRFPHFFLWASIYFFMATLLTFPADETKYECVQREGSFNNWGNSSRNICELGPFNCRTIL